MRVVEVSNYLGLSVLTYWSPCLCSYWPTPNGSQRLRGPEWCGPSRPPSRHSQTEREGQEIHQGAGVQANGNYHPPNRTLQGNWSQTQTRCPILHALFIHLPDPCPGSYLKTKTVFRFSFSRSLRKTTASLALANNLGNLTPSSCVNAQALMNNHFGIRAVKRNPWVNFTLANE